MAKLEPGEVAAIGFLAGGLTSSIVLVALGYEPTSTCVRKNLALKIAYGLIVVHMAFRVPGDPLTYCGGAVERLIAARRLKPCNYRQSPSIDSA